MKGMKMPTHHLKMPPVVTVHTLHEFVEALSRIMVEINRLNDSTGELLTMFFRGQSNSKWKLQPRVFGRQYPTFPFQYDIDKWKDGAEYYRSRMKVEIIETIGEIANQKMLFREAEIAAEFMNEYPQFFHDGMSWLDRLTVLQHYGVPTRLLDVTRNAMVALYFALDACQEKCEKQDGVVFVLPVPRDDLDWALQFDKQKSIAALADPVFWKCPSLSAAWKDRCVAKISRDKLKPLIVAPKFMTERQRRQQGTFFLFPNKVSGRGEILQKAGLIDLEWKTKILIAADSKKSIRSELESVCGLNEHYLFPENVDGFAKGLVAKAKAIANDKTGVLFK